jgi:hypothetical protein
VAFNHRAAQQQQQQQQQQQRAGGNESAASVWLKQGNASGHPQHQTAALADHAVKLVMYFAAMHKISLDPHRSCCKTISITP